ncbi:hypothetical protein M1567_01230 [Candidatus Marsarchaeota archaeon]|jgi:hypothetical protein|nr:hypothetical protein [Candidatus Marsarchaeota archaeon]
MGESYNMKLQGSIEFIIIMAAVASMGMIGVSYYSRVHSVMIGTLNAKNSNSVGLHESMAAANDTISAYLLAPEMQVGSASMATLLITTSLPSAISVSIKSPSVGLSRKNFSSSGYEKQASFVFYAIPTLTGANNVSFEITAFNGSSKSEYDANASLYAYVSNQSKSLGNPAAGAISYVRLHPENESVVYTAGKHSRLYYITESSHCSELNFWGQQMPIQSQCPGASWYFWAFSANCYYGSAQVPTKTYCVYKTYSGYNASALSSTLRYNYNVTLEIGYEGLNLSSDMNKNSNSNITYNGKVFGTAAPGNSIYAQSIQPGSLYIFNSGDKIYTGSNANYSAYGYAYSNIKDNLAYYNNSGNGATGTIDREIYAYNNSLSRLISTLEPADSGLCNASINGNSILYECRPDSPMQFYNVTADIYNYTGKQSEYSYMGSEIRVS